MSELHGHVEKLWSGPTPETVYKMNVPYVPGDNCPICAQPITIDRNIDGSSDWSCILCGWRREKSPAKLQDYLPGQLTTMNKPGEQGKTKRICTDCKKTFLAFPVSLQTTCGSCRSAAQTRKHRRGADADRRKYFTVIPGVISELLKVKGESQHVLEKALGVYNGAATLWNSGKYGISEGHLDKAAAYFGVDRGKIAVERTGKDPDAPQKGNVQGERGEMKQTGDNAKQEFIKTAYELEDSFGENHRGGGFIPAKFGLCSSCDCFSYAELQYSREYAKCNCDGMGRWPNGSNPVKKCSRYVKRGQTSLREMAELAYYISADKKKIGFERG